MTVDGGAALDEVVCVCEPVVELVVVLVVELVVVGEA
jgi:hypothetical protein